uniref:Uncharacterized protein n=1 Tax=Glossina pallidipes TaxID=7398 RepID=A0A1A9Z887_GLOPL
MKLTVFCVLLVFSCLVANVENASWQDQFSDENVKKVFNTVAKSFQDAGAKVSEALSGDNIKKAFNSVMQSPQKPGSKPTRIPNKPGSKPTRIPNKEESKKKSNSSNQSLQNSTSNTTRAPIVAHLWRNLTSSVEILKNTDVSSADVVNGEDFVKNSNSLAEIPKEAATSAAETENLKKNSSSLAEDLTNSTDSAANDLKENSNSLPSAADTFTGDNLNKNSSSLAEILKNVGSDVAETISGENMEKNVQSLDASIKVAELVSAENLQTNINSLAEVLQNTSASIGEAVSSDKENSNSLGEVLTDAGSKIAGDFSSENVTNTINALKDSLHSNDCIMEIVKTILQFSKKFFVELQACADYARIEHIGKATEELIIIGKELQSTDGKQCSDQINVSALEPLAGIEIDIATDSEEDETNARIADDVQNLKADLDEAMAYWGKTSSKLSKVANDISKLSKVSGDYVGSGSSTVEEDLKYLTEALDDADHKFRKAKFY